MLKEALRRVLWLAPTLVVVSALVFWALTSSIAPAAQSNELPRFFNPSPQDVQSLAQQAADAIAANNDRSSEATARLSEIGAAGLPHLIPYLDALDPRARGRVALALDPIADRMGLSRNARRDGNPHEAVLFWNRYWQDHAIDFRPVVVRRAVERYTRRPSALRRSEVIRYDTYALESIIEQMADPETRTDVERMHRLSIAAARLTGHDWIVGDDADRETVEHVGSRWAHFWIEHAHDYVAFSGARRVAAMIRETRYGRWAADVAQGRLGTLSDGRKVLDVLAERSSSTLWLLLAALLGGVPLGIALGSYSVVGSKRLDAAATIVSVGFLSLPMALLVSTTPHVPGHVAPGVVLMAIASALLISRHQRTQQRLEVEHPSATRRIAFGMSPARLVVRQLRRSAAVAIALVATEIPALLTAAFVLEHALALPGLGPMTEAAIEQHEISWLMGLSIVTTLTVGLTQIAGDLALESLDGRALDSARTLGGHIG